MIRCPVNVLRSQRRPRDQRDRCADRALSGRRSGGVGRDRPDALAQGVQPGLQVRRPARRGRGSDAGHLPEDLQGAAHVRPARQLPDLAHQHQPQPLHRPLPQRPQRARDDGPRGGRVGPDAGLARARPARRAGADRPAPPHPRGAGGAAPGAAGGGHAARPAGVFVPGDRGQARPAGGHGQVADQSRPARARPPASVVFSLGARPAGRARVEEPNERHDLSCRRSGGHPRAGAAADLSDPVGLRDDRDQPHRRRREEDPRRPDAGRLRRQRHDRLPDGSLPAGAGRGRLAQARRASRSASRRC